MYKVSDELKPFCRSSVDADRPGWYLVHRDGFFYYEPEYAPTNPETFDQDTSFLLQIGVFFEGYGYLTLLDQPTHFLTAGPDDRVRSAKFRDTLEFKESASAYTISRNTKGESTGISFAESSDI